MKNAPLNNGNINNELLNASFIASDFDTRYLKWSNKDMTNSVGHEINSLTSSGRYKQLINKPTHIGSNTSFCIDLIFFNNQNLI